MTYDITKYGPASYRDLQELIAADQIGQLQLSATLGLLEGINISRNYTPRDPLEYVNLGPHTGAIPFGESRYDLNLLSAALYENLADVRAARQSGIAKFGAGLGKMLTTAGSTFISSTLGTVYGLGQGITEAILADENKGSAFLSGFVNNDIAKGMQEFLKKTENVLVNYYSDWEQQAPWYLKMGTANFWADGIIKNMGFTIGAAAAGLAWGGLGSALSLPSIPGIAGVLAKGAMGSIGEATIESINMMDEAENTLNLNLDGWEQGEIQKAENDYYNNLLLGVNATDAFNDYQAKLDGIALQKEELKSNPEVQDAIKAAGNAVFGWNLGLLTLTNSFELSNVFKGGKALSELIAQKQVQAFAKQLGRQPTKEEIASIFKQKGLEYTGDLLENPTRAFIGRAIATGISEGVIEEGGQNLISNTEEVYAASKWRHTPLALFMDLSATENVKSRVDAMNTALKDLYGTPQSPGWQEVAMGFIGGIVGTPFIGRKQNGKIGFTWIGGAKNAYDETIGTNNLTKDLLNKLNTAISDDKFIETFYTAVGMALSDKEYADALAKGDTEALKQEEFRAIAEQVILFDLLGKIDDLKAIYEGLANLELSDEDIEILKKVTTPEGGTSPLSSMTKEEISNIYREKAKTALEKIDIYRKAIQNANDFLTDEKVLKELDKYEPLFLQLFASRIAFLDANKQELQRRLTKIDSEITALDRPNLTKEEQDLLLLLQADRKSILDLYDKWKDFAYYKLNPTEFRKELDNWIDRVNKVTIGKEANSAIQNLLRALTVLDVIDAFKYLNPEIKNLVVRAVKNQANDLLKSLIESYETFEDDYTKVNEGLTQLAEIMFPNALGQRTVFNQVLDFARMLTLNDDAPVLNRQSLKDNINNAVEQLKAIPGNEAAVDLLDATAKLLILSIDDLNKVAPKVTTPETPNAQLNTVVTPNSDELTEQEKKEGFSNIPFMIKNNTINSTVEAIVKDFERRYNQKDILQKLLQQVKDLIQLNPNLTQDLLIRQMVSNLEKRKFPIGDAVKLGQGAVLYYFNNPSVLLPKTTPTVVTSLEPIASPTTSISGDAFNTLNVTDDGVAIEFDNSYIKELNIDIQGIRDKYLRFIDDETELHFIKSSATDKTSKMILLGVKVTDSLKSKFDKDDPLLRRGVLTINGEDYLIVGTYGYLKTQNQTTNDKYAAAVAFIEQLFKQLNPTSEGEFTVLKNITTKLYLKQWGRVVTAIKKGKETIPNSNQVVFDMLSSKELNPNNITLSNIKFLVWNNNIASSWVSDGIDKSIINFDLDELGIPKNVESGNVFILIPTVNGRLTPLKLAPIAYQEVKDRLASNELFLNEYNSVLMLLTDSELNTKTTEEKDALINQALISLRNLFQFRNSDYLFYDKDSDNFMIKDPITGNILTTISLGTLTQETRQLIIDQLKDVIERANPLINIEHERLMKTPEFYIGTTSENGLLMTNARKLATEGNKFRAYAIGNDGKIIIPTSTSSGQAVNKTRKERNKIELKVLNGRIYTSPDHINWFKGDLQVTGAELEELRLLLDAIDYGKNYKVGRTTVLKYGDTVYRISNKAYYKLDPKEQLYYDATVEIAKQEAIPLEEKPTITQPLQVQLPSTTETKSTELLILPQENLSSFDLLVLKMPNHANYVISTSELAKSLPTRVLDLTKVAPRNGSWLVQRVKTDDVLTALLQFDLNSIQDESLRALFVEKSKNGLISLLEDVISKLPGINLDKHFSLEELLNLLENYLLCHQ